MGTRPNKNLGRIINAVRGLKCKLLIVGKLHNEQKELLLQNNVNYENRFDLDDNQIIDCYVKSDIVCFPSLFEGFGRPIIEANAIGRVVITSNMEPMNEVADGAAILVNPYNELEIRKAIISAITDENLRMELIEAGLKNAEKYRATKVAQIYNDIYRMY